MNTAALLAALNGDVANALVASTPDGIERQEYEGQLAMIANAQLPGEVSGATREQLEAIGIKFGANVDDLFITVTLPKGWKLQATTHSMHSDLLDHHGRKRAGIFYKAAFYDRRASMSMRRRYSVASTPCTADGTPASYGADEHTHRSVDVLDCDTVINHVGRCADADYSSESELQSRARYFLDCHLPVWDDPMAHWDEQEAANA